MCECAGAFGLLALNKVIPLHLMLTDTYIEGQCLSPTSISYGLSPFEQQSVKDPHILNKAVSTYFVQSSHNKMAFAQTSILHFERLVLHCYTYKIKMPNANR